MTALAVLVGGNVYWLLRGVGTAMTDPDADPAYQEEILTSDDQTVIPLEEHPPDTDPWLPDQTGMTRKELIARLAEAQCGDAESLTDFETDPETGERHGVTQYGTWYNNPYGAWNTMFACWCLYHAGAEEIPCGSGCWAWSVSLAEAGLLLPADTVPERGDVLLLDMDLDGKADRCGIVTAVTEDELTVMEGDLADAVGVCSYPVGDERILGYAAAENAAAENAAAEVTAEALPEETPTVVTFHESSASGITVDVTAPEEAFPAGTFMTVSDVSHEEAMQAANGAAPETETLGAVAVDITFRTSEGEETEPAADVAVQITLPDEQQMPEGELALLHVADDGTVENVDAQIAENMVTFTAESFSVYIVTSTGEYTENQATAMNNVLLRSLRGGTIWTSEGGVTVEPIPGYFNSLTNSADNRYPVEIGETIEVSVILPIAADNPYNASTYGSFWTGSNEDNKLRRITYETLTIEDENHVRISKQYYGSVTGDCSVNFNNNLNGSTETIYLSIKSPIYVQTPLGEIEKDRVHEYLDDGIWDIGGVDNPNGGVSVLCDENGNPMYVKNCNSSQGRYYIPVNGEFTLVTYSTDRDLEFTLQGDLISKVANTRTSAPIDMPPNNANDSNRPQIYRISQRFKAGETGSGVAWGGNMVIYAGNEPFYVHVHDMDAGDKFNHSDIEISDGSYFYFESNETLSDGSVKTTTVKYSAYITEVDHCYLYDADGNRLKNLSGETLEYLTEDYEKRHEPGETQFEYTSQYKCSNNSHKWYDVEYVHGAEFKVDVLLKANSVTEIIRKGDDEVSNSTTAIQPNNPNYPDLTSTQVYKLDYDAVITALNKCPSHTGLDFNVKADTFVALAPVQAHKNLVYDTDPNSTAALQGEEFDFELLTAVEQKALKIGENDQDTQTYTVQPFTAVTKGDILRAYELIDFQNYYSWGNGLSVAPVPGLPNNQVGFGQIIDNFEIGSTSDDELSFYNTLDDYLNETNARLPYNSNAFLCEAGHFFFQRFSVVATGKNDANGNIQFTDQVFMKPGVYHYYIREKNSGNDATYNYDNSLKPVTITVTKSSSGSLSASVSYDGTTNPSEFTNVLKTYTLPSTGGSGTLPYFVTGGTLTAAAVLLLYKRRKEVHQ
ncbi:MAG: LPXTG cell wall anchor domain-containing protein [Oscillospiraceae bacterium]|nr:LPXTG cell wall anchor domain-containing protein [Oscillospiraceae bacterium]